MATKVSVDGRGRRGASNYELWLAAGNEGTVDDFLDSQAASAAVEKEAAEAAASAAIAAAGEAIASVASTAIGPMTVSTTGTVFSNLATYYWPLTVAENERYVSELRVAIASPGLINIVVAAVGGDGKLSVTSVTPVRMSAAGVQIVPLLIKVPAGNVVGIQFQTGAGYYESGTIPGGESAWSTTGLPTTNTTKTIGATNGVRWQVVMSAETFAKAKTGYEYAAEVREAVGFDLDLGWPSLVSTGSATPNDYTIVAQIPAPRDGELTSISVGSAGGAADVLVVEVDPASLVTTIVQTVPVVLEPGVCTLSLNVPVAAGQYVGLRGGNFAFQANSNPLGIPVWYRGGGLSSGDTVAVAAQHRFEVAWTVQGGLYARRSSGSTISDSGLDLLASADNTGSEDATAAFASARAAHPFPYVRPGRFALTSLPAGGEGLWGPGRVELGGKRFFLPARPMHGNLYDQMRANLAEHIAAGDVLTLIADSIGHYAYATTGPQHWFNQLTAFANFGIAADEPIMTALRPSGSYTPSFYGVTTSGSVSTGTNGPLAESLILAAGASLSFTGAYEQVDVFYTRQSGAGSLAFAFNGGSPFKTVNAAGTLEIDRYSGATATGQSASGTYTITASGGPVEITGLVRLGVKAAGSRPRLRTLRAAHGSYSFGDFGSSAVASILKQAGYAGGKCLPVIALGINDSFGLDPSVIVSTATITLDALEAGGVEKIYGLPPIRPGSSWNASYTGGRTYDPAAAAIRKLYRERGVEIIALDTIDWLNAGLLQDQLHPNGPGNDRYAQVVVEGLAS